MVTAGITENFHCDSPKAANAVVRLLPAQRNMIDYMVVCVNDYADRHGLSAVESFDYLFRYKGLDFLEECYEVEHTYNDTQIAWFKAGSALNYAAKK